MDLFDKCKNFTKSKELEEVGLYPYFQPISSKQDTEVIINGKKVLMFGSNSYLGLTVHPKVKKAAMDAVEKYGTGCAGSRFLNGTLDIHEELEEKLAEFVNKEKAILFSTGFQANLGAISALANKNEYIILDKSDHASIVDGTRLSDATIKRFLHNNMCSLEKVLSSIDINVPKFIIVDGVYSMDGDITNLPEIIKLKNRYNAKVMVDDAHSLGVIGKNGRGTANYYNLEDETDVIMGTFSKSFASLGGFIASSEEVIEYLRHFARSLIFSASITPSSTAAVLASLEIMQKEPELIEKLWENTKRMRNGVLDMGYNIGVSTTPIIPLIVGDNEKVLMMRKILFENGVFVNPVVSPAVPPNQTLIRLSLMATHTFKQIDLALEKIYEVGRKLEII